MSGAGGVVLNAHERGGLIRTMVRCTGRAGRGRLCGCNAQTITRPRPSGRSGSGGPPDGQALVYRAPAATETGQLGPP